MPELAAQTQQARQFPFAPKRSNLRQEYGKVPSHPTNRIGPFRHPGDATDSLERKTQATNTPEPKKVSYRNQCMKVDQIDNWSSVVVHQSPTRKRHGTPTTSLKPTFQPRSSVKLR